MSRLPSTRRPLHTLAIRLEADEFERLEELAGTLGLKPGTVAKSILHQSLNNEPIKQMEDPLARLRQIGLGLGNKDVSVVEMLREQRASLTRRSGMNT